MNQKPIEIHNPIIKIIETRPSSLGNVDYIMVIMEHAYVRDLDDSGSDFWYNVAEDIYQDEFEYPIYPLHMTSDRGEPIKLLDNNTENQSSKTRVNCDSLLLFHCIASQFFKDSVEIKLGFYSWMATEEKIDFQPQWSTMAFNTDCYRHIRIPYEAFWEAYTKAAQKWKSTHKVRLSI